MEWIVSFRWTNLTFDISAYDGLEVLPFFWQTQIHQGSSGFKKSQQRILIVAVWQSLVTQSVIPGSRMLFLPYTPSSNGKSYGIYVYNIYII